MNGRMNAILWDGRVYPEGLSYGSWEIPQPPPGWALVRNRAAGICGADLQALLGRTRHLMPDALFPAILGHENAGDVVALGSGVTRVKPGDRVAVEPLHGCVNFGGSCPMCRSGRYQLCLDGVSHVGMPIRRMLPGGYGEYSIVHESHLYPIPDWMDYDEAAILDVLAVNLHGAVRAQPQLGDTVCVIGCGVIGIDIIQVLRARGITDIVALARYPFQAEMAQRFGAREVVLSGPDDNPVEEVLRLTGGRGVDQAYECVGGNSAAFSQALAVTAAGGKVIMFGGTTQPSQVDLSKILFGELTVLGSNSYCMQGDKDEFQIALQMVQNGQVDHKSLITHRFRPEDFEKAFQLLFSKGNSHLCKAVWYRDAL